MQDLLPLAHTPPLAPTIFLTHIGFSIAAFAFLCNYLAFPKGLLADLAHMNNGPPRLYPAPFTSDDYRIVSIRHFFYEIDVVTYAILVFIVYSSVYSLLCSMVNLSVVTPGCGISWAYGTAAVYVIWNISLARTLLDKTFRPDWIHKTRFFCFYVGVLLFWLCGMIASLWICHSGLGLFGWNVFILVLLLAWYLIPIQNRLPVTHLLELWTALGRRNP
jgi:hypothetical protein